MITPKPFYMIRHGETEANAARIMAGSLDSPLTDKGRDQAASAARILEQIAPKPVAIIHSHLSRARDTAQILNTRMSLPMHENPDLAEMHTGDWEGLPYEECGSLMTEWIDPPQGETSLAFQTRITRGKNSALGLYEDRVLIVSHGGVFRAFGKVYDLDIPGRFLNCHLYEFEPYLHRPDFPWRVWQYDEQEDGAIMRAPAGLFHAAGD